jgi:hypothetical protein
MCRNCLPHRLVRPEEEPISGNLSSAASIHSMSPQERDHFLA